MEFLGYFLTLCFVLLLIALLIVALPAWIWFLVALFLISMFIFGDKNEK